MIIFSHVGLSFSKRCCYVWINWIKSMLYCPNIYWLTGVYMNGPDREKNIKCIIKKIDYIYIFYFLKELLLWKLTPMRRNAERHETATCNNVYICIRIFLHGEKKNIFQYIEQTKIFTVFNNTYLKKRLLSRCSEFVN